MKQKVNHLGYHFTAELSKESKFGAQYEKNYIAKLSEFFKKQILILHNKE